MIDTGLSTVPFEEVSVEDGEPGDASHFGKIAGDQERAEREKEAGDIIDGAKRVEPIHETNGNPTEWRSVVLHFGKSKGCSLGDLKPASLRWWIEDWQPKPLPNRPLSAADAGLRAALDAAKVELSAAN